VFKRILVPFDGSEHSWSAVQHAMWIAEIEGHAIIHGLHVVDISKIQSLWVPGTVAGYGNWSGADYFGIIQHDLEEAGRNLLDEMAKRCAQNNLTCATEMATGTVDRVIVDRASDFDLIVMGHRGTRAHWAGFLLGSVFESVIRHAVPPVLGCMQQPRPIRKVLAAFDGSQTGADALRVAAGIAASWHLPLTVVAVREPGRVEQGTVDDLNRILAQQNAPAEVLWREGRPSDEILAAADGAGCDLIVLGATGHSELADFFFGSTVDRVVHRSHVPIMVCH
jgi:nucleotide-binding universal stress UspA family protein